VIQAFKASMALIYRLLNKAILKYKSFNDFYPCIKTLRLVDENPDSIVSPADGAISQLVKLKQGEVFQAKGQSFSVEN
jgi:phosphatidylserine decarboxylase